MVDGYVPYTPSRHMIFWCQKVLPLVYDDSLSYMELLCKVVAQLNEMADSLNQMGESLNTLNAAINEIEQFVNNKLSDDSLKSIIQPIVEELLQTGQFNIPVASSTQIGGIKVGNNLTITPDGQLNAQNSYVLPTASATIKGGIKVGNNLTMIGETLNANDQSFTLQPASSTTLGGVKSTPNNAVTIDSDGKISVRTASANNTGVVKAGTGIIIATDGTISATGGSTPENVEWGSIKNVPEALPGGGLGCVRLPSYAVLPEDSQDFAWRAESDNEMYFSLSDAIIEKLNNPVNSIPSADKTTFGGVIVGNNINVSAGGKINVPLASNTSPGVVIVGGQLTIDSDGRISYVLPKATNSSIGGIKSSTTVNVGTDGTASVPNATTGVKGVVQIGTGLTISNGLVRVRTGTPYGTLSGTTLTLTLQ